MKAPSPAGGLRLRRRPTGCGRAGAAFGIPRQELGLGLGAGEKKAEGTARTRGFGKVDRLERKGSTYHQAPRRNGDVAPTHAGNTNESRLITIHPFRELFANNFHSCVI